MAAYIQIGHDPKSDLLIEIPSEKNGTLLLTSVAAQYPGATGVRFQSESGAWRGCRIEGNVISAPDDGWGTRAYYVVKPASKRAAEKQMADGGEKKKARGDEEEESDDDDYSPRIEKLHLPDLMIAALPFSAEDDEIKEYFENFGPLESFRIMTNDTGKSRGFGFIKFKTAKATRAALDAEHFIHNRPVDIRFTKQALQNLQMGYGLDCVPNDNIPTKLFIGRLPIGTTSGELTEVFKKYGPLKDVYIPQYAKGFGFVTFPSVTKAFKAMSDTHVCKGQFLNVLMSNGKQNKPPGPDGNVPINNPNNLSASNNILSINNMSNLLGNPLMGMPGLNAKQARQHSMAQILLDGMCRLTQQQRQGNRQEQFNNNNSPGFNSGVNSSYGGAPGAGALAGALGGSIGGKGNEW